jgi:pSer/pThr/pTyr-binding forkhead associated (FHA) protein
MNAILAFILRLILLILLYGFIGWMGFTIFTDLRKSLQTPTQFFLPPITLQVDPSEDTAAKKFEVANIVIGRDPSCEFPLEDHTISLHHARLSFHHKQWWVEDLGSTNGTFLNETRVKSPTVLTNYDQLRLGQVTMTVTIQ